MIFRKKLETHTGAILRKAEEECQDLDVLWSSLMKAVGVEASDDSEAVQT